MKHVGRLKTTGTNVIIAYRTIPDDALSALVIDRDAMRPFEEDIVEKAAQACENACNPIEDKRGTVSYRKKVSKVLFKRALDKAIERAKRG